MENDELLTSGSPVVKYNQYAAEIGSPPRGLGSGGKGAAGVDFIDEDHGAFGGEEGRDRNVSSGYHDGLDAYRLRFHNKRTRGGFFSTTANLLCTMVGGGMLAMPRACLGGSIAWFSTSVVVAMLLSILSSYYILVCCDISGEYTFQGIVMCALRTKFPSIGHKPGLTSKFVESIIWLSNLAALVMYMQIIGATLPHIMQSVLTDEQNSDPNLEFVFNKWFWIGGSGALFLLTACFKTLRELFVVSVLGFLSMVYIMVVVVYSFTADATKPNGSELLNLRRGNSTLSYYEPTGDGQGLLTCFSIVGTAMLIQMNVPQLYHELGKRRSRRHMMGSIFISYVVGSGIYLITGLVGYYHFALQVNNEESEGNIILNYEKDYLPMTIGQIMMYVHLLCAIPIYIAVARRSFSVVFVGTDQPHWPARTAITIALVGVACGVGGNIPGLGVGATYYGAIFGITIALTIPAILFYFNFTKLKQDFEPDRSSSSKVFAFLVAVFGILVSLASIIVTSLQESNVLVQDFGPGVEVQD